MNVLIILGHPDQKSFNHAIAEACKTQLETNGHVVFYHDLYAEEFNPLYHLSNSTVNEEDNKEIKTHHSHLINSDGLIIIHPNWWGQPPAIVKGWMDRVLIRGVAYDFTTSDKGQAIPVGLLKAQTGVVLNSSNTPDSQETDLLDLIWKEQVFGFIGIKKSVRKNFGIVKESDPKQRENWLSEILQLVDSHFPKTK